MILKYSEPITLITDGALGIQSFIFALLLAFYLAKNVEGTIKKESTLNWALCFFSMGIFALAGAIGHFTTSEEIYWSVWPFCVSFGAVALFFANLEVQVLFFGSRKYQFVKTLIPYAVVQILIIVFNYAFIWFGVYLVYTVAVYFILYFIDKKSGSQDRDTDKTKFIKVVGIYLFVFLILGIIQTIAKAAGWVIFFGPNSEYLFQPGNEIFHVAALILNQVFYSKLKVYLAFQPNKE